MGRVKDKSDRYWWGVDDEAPTAQTGRGLSTSLISCVMHY